MGHAQFIRQLGIIIGRAKFQALYIQVISQNVLRIFIDSRHILGIGSKIKIFLQFGLPKFVQVGTAQAQH